MTSGFSRGEEHGGHGALAATDGSLAAESDSDRHTGAGGSPGSSRAHSSANGSAPPGGPSPRRAAWHPVPRLALGANGGG
ncbi:hypothetical protein QDK90_34075, partial [Streptomyces sp. 12257]|nr:hypothetical protein [Streptomyces sp. 12257]